MNKDALYNSENSEEGEYSWWNGWKPKTYNYQDYSLWGVKTYTTVTYINQMADAMSEEHKVKVTPSDYWGVDIKKKKLLYNPDDLTAKGKSSVLSLLLHEVGYIKYSSDPTGLRSPFWLKYPHSAPSVFNAFEDPRTDKLIVNDYPTAYEIYMAMCDDVKTMVNSYRVNRKEAMQKDLGLMMHYMQYVINEVPEFKDITTQAAFVKKAIEFLDRKYRLKDYLSIVQAHAYDVHEKWTERDYPKHIVDMANRTVVHIETAKDLESAAEVLEMMDHEVYPIIKKLLEEANEPNKTMKMLGEVSGQGKNGVGDERLSRVRGHGNSDTVVLDGEALRQDYNKLSQHGA